MSHFKKDKLDQRGSVLLELAIALPVLITLFLISNDLVRAIQNQQKMSLFTKEIAHAVFQDCIELEDPNQCIADSYNTIFNTAKTVLGDTEVEFLLTVYQCDLDSSGNCDGGITTIKKCPDSSCVSSYSGEGSKYSSKFTGSGDAVDTLKDQGRIVVAECFHRFTPFINASPLHLVLYDSAVY